MKYTKDCGKNLRWVRQKLGLTQVELAKKIGKAQYTVCSYELNAFRINKEVAEKVVKIARKQGIKVTVSMLRPIRRKYVGI